MIRLHRIFVAPVMLAILPSWWAMAHAGPNLLSYQGQLTDGNGPAVGPVDLTFRIYDTSGGGTLLWEEAHAGVALTDGIYNIVLGSITPFDETLFDGVARWLETSVDGSPLSPRRRFLSTPYALRSKVADVALSGGDADADWIIDGDEMYAGVSGNVGIGTSDAQSKLHVYDTERAVSIEVESTGLGPGLASSANVRLAVNDGGGGVIDGGIGFSANGPDGRLLSLATDEPNARTLIRSYHDDVLVSAGQDFNINAARVIYDPVGAGGEVSLVNSNGFAAIRMEPHENGAASDGGVLKISDASGSETLELDGREGTGGSVLFMRDAAGTITVEIDALEENEGGGEIKLFDASGDLKIELDADIFGSSRIVTDVLEINGGSDLSERFDIRSHAVEIAPGMVVSIDPSSPGALVVSGTSYDRRVAGIVSGAGGVRPGMLMGQSESVADGAHPVALTGRVYVYVDASYGAVEPGDLLTTSDTPGHAMKVDDHVRAQGAILGKAIGTLQSGRGLVLALVTLQ